MKLGLGGAIKRTELGLCGAFETTRSTYIKLMRSYTDFLFQFLFGVSAT